MWGPIIVLVVGLLTIVSLLLGLRKSIRTLVQEVVVRVLVDVGLISQADKPRDQWPNGSTNLPAFLLSMWQSQEYTQASLHDLLKREKERDDEL